MLRLLREGVQDRQVEGEGLAGCRAGRDDHVLAARRRLPCVRLVCVERGDSLLRERAAHPRIEFLRQPCDPCRPGRLLADVRNLLAREQVIPERDADAYRRHLSATMYG